MDIGIILATAFIGFACLYDGRNAFGAELAFMRFSNRKVGGIRFVRIGRLFLSFGVSRN